MIIIGPRTASWACDLLQRYLSKIMNQPVCSPNLTSGNFYPLGPLKKGLGGKRLATVLYVRSIIRTGSRDGVLGIVAILLDERPANLCLIHDKRQDLFTLQRYRYWLWGPPILLLNGCLGSFLG